MNNTTKYLLWFIIGAAIIVSIILPFASEHPDGLEKVAESLGFIDEAKEAYLASPMPDYDVTGDGSYISMFLAEIIGIILVLGLGLGIGYLIKQRKCTTNT